VEFADAQGKLQKHQVAVQACGSLIALR
jgi:hypothetical protein